MSARDIRLLCTGVDVITNRKNNVYICLHK
jgi:hypothetical protein